jgi:hypothetical protein
MLAFVLLAAALAVETPPGVVIDHEPASSRRYIGSPSIAILSDGSYVASHDFFGPASNQGVSGVTRVFRSTDRGKSWERTAEFGDQFWSNLFVHRGALYLMGTSGEYGRIVIRRSRDGGRTWSAGSFLTTAPKYHTAPVPVAIYKGRVWRAFELHPPGPWGFFQALALSAPVKADLLEARSWSMAQPLPFPADAPQGKHWLEGNIVIGPHRELLDILRVDNVEEAAITRVARDRLRFDGMVAFPGGAKKFTIRYDRKSKLYWALSNPAPGVGNPASVRNTLALISSPDLRQWQVRRTILTHPDEVRHAFQYADWQFDGEDLVVVSRTAFDDEEGGASRGHDANFMTFHRSSDSASGGGRGCDAAGPGGDLFGPRSCRCGVGAERRKFLALRSGLGPAVGEAGDDYQSAGRPRNRRPGSFQDDECGTDGRTRRS